MPCSVVAACPERRTSSSSASSTPHWKQAADAVAQTSFSAAQLWETTASTAVSVNGHRLRGRCLHHSGVAARLLRSLRRSAEDLVGCTEDECAVTAGVHVLHEVGGHDDGRGGAQLPKPGVQAVPLGRVETGGGFVEQKQPRVVHQGDRLQGRSWRSLRHGRTAPRLIGVPSSTGGAGQVAANSRTGRRRCGNRSRPASAGPMWAWPSPRPGRARRGSVPRSRPRRCGPRSP